MHISGSQVLRHAQTHALAHHRARTHTTAHCAYGRAAAAKGKNVSKLHVERITIDDGVTPPVVVTSAVFAPKSGDAEKYGWQVSALPRVIPTLTEGARLQLGVGVLVQIQTQFIGRMTGISQFGLRTADKNTLMDAGWVTVQRKSSSDKTTWVEVTVENGRLSE